MRLFFLSLVGCALLFCGCASTSTQPSPASEARQHEFEYYFSGIGGEKTFDDLDSAYAYMNEAIAKFGQVSGKSQAKGGGAVLNGPLPQGNAKVTIVYFMDAFGKDGKNVLTKETADVPKEIRNSVGAYLGLLIFAGDKSACQSSYYLREGYTFTNNSYPENFTAYGNKYTATYKIGWTLKNVYEYLKG